MRQQSNNTKKGNLQITLEIFKKIYINKHDIQQNWHVCLKWSLGHFDSLTHIPVKGFVLKPSKNIFQFCLGKCYFFFNKKVLSLRRISNQIMKWCWIYVTPQQSPHSPECLRKTNKGTFWIWNNFDFWTIGMYETQLRMAWKVYKKCIRTN